MVEALSGQKEGLQISHLPRHILPPNFPGVLTASPGSTDSMIRVGTNYQAVIPECKPGEWQDMEGGVEADALACSPTWELLAGSCLRDRRWAGWVAPWHCYFSYSAFLSGSLLLLPFWA